MYERADIVLVVAGSVVPVLLNPLQVLHHVSGDRGDDRDTDCNVQVDDRGWS